MGIKKRILFTGANGMLANDLIPLFHNYDLYAYGKDKLDISNRKQVEEALFQLRPHLVLNCAAYTAVDKCEIDPTCYSVNAVGVFNLAHGCKKIKARLIHISTDYVFDGRSSKFYKETDGRNPINHYGRSKLLGELAIEAELEKFLICRVQWLFGNNGPNFVKTMINLAQKQSVIKVVDDQFGRPTSTFLLSKAIHNLIEENVNGFYHLGSNNFCSWYDFAKEILKGYKVQVLPCKSEDFPRPAERPKYGVLDIDKAKNLGVPFYSWEEHLSNFLS